DPGIERAVMGGVTTLAVLPGSANLIGGRGFIVHLEPRRGARAMRFPGAPEILKMACGENPKRVYKEQKRAPSTRMANLRNLREAFLKAQKYRRDWADYLERQADKSKPANNDKPAKEENKDEKKGEKKDEKKDPTKPPDRDLSLETLAL